LGAQAAQGANPSRLIVATASDSINVSPLDVTVITPDRQVVMNMYDPLVNVDRDGRLVPALATAWRQVNPTTLRFTLRKGVRFHHGEEFSAEDVTFTLDTVRDLARKHKNGGLFTFIDRVDAIDPFTVQIVTKKPEVMALRRLYRLGIVSAKHARANPEILNTRPNGTGPYRFVEWIKDDHLTMEAFPDAWSGTPPIQQVTWRPIKEDAARVGALIAGEIHVAHSVPTDLVPLVEKRPQLEIRAVPSMRSYWLMMVNTKPELPTAVREVRQAINLAIDREALNRALFGGQALSLATAIHPKSLGYDPQYQWRHDPGRARELLARAGYPNGFTIGMHASEGRYARDRELSQAIAGQLAKVGITVRVRNLEVGQFTEGIFRKTTDPLVLYAFSDSDRDRTGNFSVSHESGQLWTVFSYPRLDELIARAHGTLEESERANVLRQVQAWMMDQAPAAYLLTLVDIFGVSRALRWEPRPDDVLSWREAAWTR
jgi:peptide/nickel transport system substrate-binding protein